MLIPLSASFVAALGGWGFSAVWSQASAQQIADSSSLVSRALSAELAATQDDSHPMRYWLHKSSPRLTTVKEMVETRDGLVAMLVSVNNAAPSTEDAQKEKARLDALMADQKKQEHRKQSEDADTERARKVLRALPRAFLYQDKGVVNTVSGSMERFSFVPNPKFNPPDMETEVLTQMTGEIWVDPVHLRVAHLEGQLQNDVDFGWGMLGRLYKGGTVAIDQSDVGGGSWRIVHFEMKMNARVLFRMRSFDTVEDETHFTPVPQGIDYRQGIRMLRGN